MPSAPRFQPAASRIAFARSGAYAVNGMSLGVEGSIVGNTTSCKMPTP
jgi:hypothetical protein